ncbi:MAG: B12-binding domain-containing radical SAM protein [Candidatus Sumerlaeia bacterium]|nr:B12-binding domain-containing radical SAM protein [Candidatus Sumerlaeia bacterium]
MARIALITTYNPGAAGPRYIAASLQAAGHVVKFVHFKELRAVAVPTLDFEHHARLKRDALKYVAFQHPGEVLYVPYPTPITEREKDLLIAELTAFRPDAIGVSLYSVTFDVAKIISALVRQRMPGLPIIWGGIHCMLDPEGSIEHADVVCTGEGEIPAVQLFEQWAAFRRGERVEIPGLWTRCGDEVVRTSTKEALHGELDDYPFPVYGQDEVLIDDDTVDRVKMMDKTGWLHNHIYLFTERGCPYKCSFCIHSVLNEGPQGFQRIRRRSVDNVLAEVERRVAENEMRHFIFHDEIFAIQKPWIMEFAAKWKERFTPAGLTFTGYVHPQTTDAEMVAALFEAGMTITGIGIQSGSERTTKEIFDRGHTPKKTIEMSRLLAEYPFDLVQLDIISDNPYEDEAARRETLEYLLQMQPPFRVETFGLREYEGSKLMMEKRKLMDEVPWKERLFWNMLYHLTGLPHLQRDTIRSLSRDPHLRENPEILEQLVVDLYRGYEAQREREITDRQRQRLALAKAQHDMIDPSRMKPGGGNGHGSAPDGGFQEVWTGYRFKRVAVTQG